MKSRREAGPVPSPTQAIASPAEGRSVAFAKTTRPAIEAIVPRERLFLKMDGDRPVTWISGPPGAGKTTLAASYVASRQRRCLWYQVDADDADVATFFLYLGHAARKLEGVRLKDLPVFPTAPQADPGVFARRFFRELLGRARPPFSLVIDNLHSVPQESALHAVLEAAFGQVPRGCSVIVTSRSEPPPALARLRVSGALACIGREDLRIDAAEVMDLARIRGHTLAEGNAAQLHERTQGWAAGLVLMLEHAKFSGRIAELPGDAAPQLVFDYLAGEIFERFDPKTQRFLLKIACLPRMTAEVARTLAGEDKAPRLLLNLALNNYFVSEVQSEEGRSFQFHPLLRSFLRDRAAADLPEALAPDHLRRAAALLHEAGQAVEAIALLMECRDWDAVARIAAEEAGAMLAQGRSETLRGWLESLPPTMLEADPRLLAALGTCLAHASPRAARRLFEQAYEGFHASGASEGAATACCGVIASTLDEFDDLTLLDPWLAKLADLAALPSEAAAALAHALLMRNPGSADLEALLQNHALPLERAAAALLRDDPGGWLSGIEGMAAGQSGIKSGFTSGVTAAQVATARTLLAFTDFLQGAHAEAARKAGDCLALCDSEGLPSLARWLHALQAAALLDGGDRDAARGALQRLQEGVSRRGDRALLHYLRGWLAELDGDAPAAQREARAAATLAGETGLPWLECLAKVALARILADAGDRRGCDAHLRAAASLAEKSRSPMLAFTVGIAEAGAALASNDTLLTDRLPDRLRTAFALGRTHAIRTIPWLRGRETAELCEYALRHDIEPAFARDLVRARGLVPGVPPLRTPGWPWPLRISTLGGFKLLEDGTAVEFAGKGPGRPMELLKVLIAMGGRNVRADQLADALWPHVDADYASKSFTATLHRLRKLLGDDEALLLRDARLSLHPALAWVDASALELVLGEFEDVLRLPQVQRVAEALRPLVDEVLQLYRGPFLPDESEQPAYIAFREQVRARVLRSLARAARQWEDTGDKDAAVDCYLQLVEADPLFEAPYRNLMLCYQRGGDAAEARTVYERLRTILSMRLNMMPSPETQAVYAALGAPAGG